MLWGKEKVFCTAKSEVRGKDLDMLVQQIQPDEHPDGYKSPRQLLMMYVDYQVNAVRNGEWERTGKVKDIPLPIKFKLIR